MVLQPTTLNPNLIHELRELASKGATTRQLIDKVRGNSEAADAVIAILAYLSRAFYVPLPTILPLREDLGAGAFGNAIQVAFWFAALLTRGVQLAPWDWDRFWRRFPDKFSARDLASLPTDVGYIGFIHPSNSPRDLYARVAFDAYVDKIEALGPTAGEVFGQMCQIREGFRELFAHTAEHDNGNGPSVQMKFDYQIADQGPKLHVACMAEVLQELTVPLGEAAMTAR